MKTIKKHPLLVSIISICSVILVLISLMIAKMIDLAIGVSFISLLTSVAILVNNRNEITNRLRPWVYISQADTIITLKEPVYFAFYIINTGSTPARDFVYTIIWYIQENNEWKQLELLGESPMNTKAITLFPNQSIEVHVEQQKVVDASQHKNLKVTFFMKYRGLWSKYITTNTLRLDSKYVSFLPDNPQDYT